jgi:hypothetical protein
VAAVVKEMHHGTEQQEEVGPRTGNVVPVLADEVENRDDRQHCTGDEPGAGHDRLVIVPFAKSAGRGPDVISGYASRRFGQQAHLEWGGGNARTQHPSAHWH